MLVSTCGDCCDLWIWCVEYQRYVNLRIVRFLNQSGSRGQTLSVPGARSEQVVTWVSQAGKKGQVQRRVCYLTLLQDETAPSHFSQGCWVRKIVVQRHGMKHLAASESCSKEKVQAGNTDRVLCSHICLQLSACWEYLHPFLFILEIEDPAPRLSSILPCASFRSHILV